MDSMNRDGMTGKLKDLPPWWHGSKDVFESFDFMNTGKSTHNSGAIGPGNYFSVHASQYGYDPFIGRTVNLQPYYITGIESTPIGYKMQDKGILPDFIRRGYFSSDDAYNSAMQNVLNRNIPGSETTFFLDPNEFTGGLIDTAHIAGMLHRNTGIKSLYPHPSRLIRDTNGKLIILPTD